MHNRAFRVVTLALVVDSDSQVDESREDNNATTGDIAILEDASCALKIEIVRDTLKHLPSQSPALPTLPSSEADIDTLANRLNDSLLIVISR